LTDKDDLPVPGEGPDGIAADDVIAQRVARLTPGQLDCLRLVDQHLSSKEIAAELSISPHTVDQRIRQALHILGVERRDAVGPLTGYRQIVLVRQNNPRPAHLRQLPSMSLDEL
jgi:DNA-binding CsgD family transcriptional regulator